MTNLPSFPSPSAGDLRELPRVPLRGEGSDPMDCSPPGSSVHGIFPARVLEWGAIAFSETSGRCPIPLIPPLQPQATPNLLSAAVIDLLVLSSSYRHKQYVILCDWLVSLNKMFSRCTL